MDTEDQYTKSFLSGSVKPTILFELIHANKFINQKISVDTCFTLHIGDSVDFSLQTDATNGHPIVRKTDAQNRPDKLKFILTDTGFLIKKLAMQDLYLTTATRQMNLGDSSRVLWRPISVNNI